MDDTSPSNQLLGKNVQPTSMQNQSPPEDSTGNSNLVPSTGSTLVADSFLDEIPGFNAARDAAAAGIGAALVGTFDLFLGRAHDVNLLLNDNPPDRHRVNQLKKDDGAAHGGGAQGGVGVKSGGVAGAAADAGKFDLENLCPPERFSLRTVPWCDLGYPRSVFIQAGYEIAVIGYACTVFLIDLPRPLPPFSMMSQTLTIYFTTRMQFLERASVLIRYTGAATRWIPRTQT
ncbi:hypothetical protein MMC07_000058 [Pseudocyphellaria aurata]|nr:hypothetical protein [Pseudocyphellaria aurata]